MNSKRPDPVPTLHILGKAPAAEPPAAPEPPPPAPPPQPEPEADDVDVPVTRRKKKRTGTGTQRNPYVDDRGIPRAKLQLRAELALVEEFNIFCATYLKPGEKAPWVARVLRSAMARRRRAAGGAGETEASPAHDDPP